MKYGLFITLLLTASSLLGQNIYTALHLNRPEDVRENKEIKEILEENIFINSSGQEIKKNKKTINHNHLVQTEERFDDQGKLTDRLTRKFDSLGQKTISRQFERWNKVIGYSLEIASYKYDSNGYLVSMTDRNSKGQTIQQAILSNNEKGHPLKLELYDGNGNLYGIEVATYNYLTNKALTAVKDKSGKTLSSDSTTIDFTKSKDFPRQGDIFNEHGDLVSSKNYEYQRKYDEFGNWTTETIYKVTNGKRKKDRIFKRKIKYSE
jgi:arginine repressor